MTSTPRAQALHDLHTLFGDRIHAYTIPASYPHPPVFVEASFRTPHPSKLAPLGIDACEVLRQQGKQNWLGDIANALQRLHGPIVATLDDFCSTERVNVLYHPWTPCGKTRLWISSRVRLLRLSWPHATRILMQHLIASGLTLVYASHPTELP